MPNRHPQQHAAANTILTDDMQCMPNLEALGLHYPPDFVEIT